MKQYESHKKTPDLGYVIKYMKCLRCGIEDPNNNEYTKEMDELWKNMGIEAKHFLFSIQLRSSFIYFPKGAIIDIQSQPREDSEHYWKVLFETFGTYKQR